MHYYCITGMTVIRAFALSCLFSSAFSAVELRKAGSRLASSRLCLVSAVRGGADESSLSGEAEPRADARSGVSGF